MTKELGMKCHHVYNLFSNGSGGKKDQGEAYKIVFCYYFRLSADVKKYFKVGEGGALHALSA